MYMYVCMYVCMYIYLLSGCHPVAVVQYTFTQNNTVQNIKNNKNTTDIQCRHDKSYFNLSKIYQKRICAAQNAQFYKRKYSWSWLEKNAVYSTKRETG
jgi:hypothetical protein